MALTKLKVDETNTVIAMGWANPNERKAGDVTEDGFTVYDLPDDEVTAAVVYHTKLVDGHLVVDADYVPPKLPEQQINPDDEAGAALAKQVADLTVSNAALAKQTANSAIANATLAKQVATLMAAQTKKETE